MEHMLIGALKIWRGNLVRMLAGLSLALFVAACQSAPPPAPPAPDPGPPPAPRPPLGAAHGIYIPTADPETGERKTPNSDIDPDETIWHFRSAFNVASLSCDSPAYAGINDYYYDFLRNSGTTLQQVNRKIDRKFKEAFPAVNGLRVRDTHSTQLYNYFSLPPTMDLLCQLLYENALPATTLSEAELYPFSARVLKELDEIFIKFYEDYEDYMRRLAEWEALYGTRGEVIVGGGALYSNTPTGPARPEAVSPRTGADFDQMPPSMQGNPGSAPRFPTQQEAESMDDGLPSGYEPSAQEPVFQDGTGTGQR